MQVEDTPGLTSPILTDHARERAQLRGVPIRIVEAIYANADRSPFVGSGRRSLMVSRRQLARLADSIPAADRERMKSKEDRVAEVQCRIIASWKRRRRQPQNFPSELLRVYSGGEPWEASYKINNVVGEFRWIEVENKERYLKVAGEVDFADHMIRRKRVLRTHQRH